MGKFSLAFMTVLPDGIIKLLETGAVFDWPSLKPVLVAGICAALSYLLKCLVTNSRDQMFRMEPE